MDTEQDHTGILPARRLRHALRGAEVRRSARRLPPAPSGCWPPTCRRCSPTRTAAPGARPSSTPRRDSPSRRLPRSPRSGRIPKEQALVDLVAAERLEGRRVLVYATHTGTRDITERMDGILSRHGFRVAVMKADAVAPERREAWVAEQVQRGIDVLICHPRLVQTGLDLIEFPTICLVRDGLLRLHDAAGLPPLVAHRPEPTGAGRVHGLSGTACRRTP